MSTEHDKRQYPLYLYEFRYRCERTGKWRKARYRAELHEMRERYAEFEIIGADDDRRAEHGNVQPFSFSVIRHTAGRPVALCEFDGWNDG